MCSCLVICAASMREIFLRLNGCLKYVTSDFLEKEQCAVSLAVLFHLAKEYGSLNNLK